jgi:hypothetical protein
MAALQPGEYPEPTPATVKLLYGNAFSCAKPDCSRTLYKLDAETGSRTLNSEIAHIHARKPKGPRYIIMAPEDNRSAGNLVLLCLEHHAEVDDPAQVHRFPPELLRDWKAQQLADSDRRGQAWPITDDEASEVLAQLSARETGLVGVGASVLAALARAASQLASVAENGRRGSAAEARRLRDLYEQAGRLSFGYDEQGKTVRAEPAPFEVRGHEQAVAAALTVAGEKAGLALQGLLAECAALTATDPAVAAWCEWVARSGVQVVAATERWPKEPPNFDDDEVLSQALGELRVAVAATAARWRGEEVPPPPAPPMPPEPEPESKSESRRRRHRELLERARPYGRVQHLPFDPALQQELIAATKYAAALPATVDNLPFDLDSTASLAALVTRNATPEQQSSLLAQAADVKPLAAAVQLSRHVMIESRETEQSALADEADQQCRDLLLNERWDRATTWVENESQARWLLATTAQLHGAQAVQATLSSALAQDPDLLPVMLVACSRWVTNEDRRTGDRVDRRQYEPDDLAAWLPVEQWLAAIEQALPSAADATWRELALEFKAAAAASRA